MLQNMAVTPVTVAWAAAAAGAQPPGAPESAPLPAGDKSAFTLFNPTSRGRMREFITDRPDTTESPNTVDAGHVQLEMSFAQYTYDRDGDAATRTWCIAPMLLRLGVLGAVDVHLGINPYERARTTGGGAEPETADGFGDMYARIKVNFWGNDAGEGPWETAFALLPFVSFPTGADELSSGHVEGGIALPFSVALPAGFGLGVMAEFDFNRSVANDRYVVDFLHSAALDRTLIGDLGAYLEYAGYANLNADEDYRAYFNTGLTYLLTPDVQLDLGVSLGLTGAADNVTAFSGISFRY